MKTILYLQSSFNASNNSVLDGVSRYAKSANWKARTTPFGAFGEDHFEIAKSCGYGSANALRKVFKYFGTSRYHDDKRHVQDVIDRARRV